MASDDYTSEQIQDIANELRADVIRMLAKAGSGHPASSLALAELMAALYFKILRHDPDRPDWNERDILVVSNGHCVPIRYAAMARAGYLERKELLSLRRFGSRLQGHPIRTALIGLETTSGPLGCGLSQAVGMAIALKIDDQVQRRVYCLLGDGELDEGQNWEAAMLAHKLGLGNLIALIDRNNIQLDGPTESVMPLEDLKAKWEAFGWHTIETDGHNIEAIIDACQMAKAIVEHPVVIILHTIPGKGVSYMEYDYRWHGQTLDHSQTVEALREIRTLGGKVEDEHQ